MGIVGSLSGTYIKKLQVVKEAISIVVSPETSKKKNFDCTSQCSLLCINIWRLSFCLEGQ